MHKYVGALLSLMFCIAALPAAAQETPKVEISAGYSYVRANLIPDNGCCFAMNGGSGSVAFNANNWLGLVAEVGGYHSGNVQSTGLDLNVVTYLFGPRISYRRYDRITPFAHVLLGGGHASGSLYTGTATSPGLGTQNAFAMAAGGGLDVKVARHLAIRLIQADYFFTHFANGVNDHQNSLRISAGFVLRLGQR